MTGSRVGSVGSSSFWSDWPFFTLAARHFVLTPV